MAQLIFKTTTFLLLLLSFATSLYAQKESTITLEGEQTLHELFIGIEKQTGYSIDYNHSTFPLKVKKKVAFRQTPLPQVLSFILKGSGYTFKIKGKHILIIKGKSSATTPTQNIRGKVFDAQTQEAVYATVRILNEETSNKGTITDSLGNFRLSHLPVGRYALQISSIGYESVTLTELNLGSAKETYCEVPLKESTQELNEVIVRAPLYKNQLLNPMALSGGRMLSMEEASRYAGGFDDPARLVSSFAGVSGSVSSNAIEVRGNAPQYVQWRMEGIETPNFTHYADVSGLGGGLLTGLSSQVVSNSDFYYSAFPAEYSNALAGVFDMNMRKGNTQAFEHAFQIGVWGIDAASEGPIGKKGKSSYLFNYRYSYSGLADAISGADEGLNYQDLAFKVNIPTRKAGTFSLWGVGLTDKVKVKYDEDQKNWEEIGDMQQQTDRFYKGILGITHQLPMAKDAFLKTSVAATYSGVKAEVEQTDKDYKLHTMGDVQNNATNLIVDSYYSRRYSARHTNRTGITATGMFYDIKLNASPNVTLYQPMIQYAKENGSSMATSAYSHSLIRLSKEWKMNIGLNAQYFALNRAWSIEPRASVQWQYLPTQSVSLAYGLHSRRERTEYYFTHLPDNEATNRDLKLSKAHHINLTYNWSPSPLLNIKVEPYLQYLYNIPVEENSSFSIINFNGYVLDRLLVNKGKGLNYGIDVSIDRYLHKSWYWMLSGSLFKSKYMGGDGIWRSSRMDRRFMLKALVGKEWTLGKNSNKTLSLNLRMIYQGGERYTPIDYQASGENHKLEEDETRAYSLHMPASFISDFTINYKINKKRVSHEFSLKFLNVNGFKNTRNRYNMMTNQIETLKEAPILPSFSYKIYF